MILYLIQSRLTRSYSRLLFPSQSFSLRSTNKFFHYSLIAKSTKTKHSSFQDFRLLSTAISNSTSPIAPPRKANPKFEISGSAEQSELINYLKMKDFEGLSSIYHINKAEGMLPLKVASFKTFLSVCHDVVHLPFALELFEDMMALNLEPDEPIFLSLIRCYSSVGDVLTSLNIIKQMRDNGIEPRLRTYQPIIDALYKVSIVHLNNYSYIIRLFIGRRY